MNFRYTAAGIIKQVTGESYPERLNKLAEKLGVQDEKSCVDLQLESVEDVPGNRADTLASSIIEDLNVFQEATNLSNGNEVDDGRADAGGLYEGGDVQGKREKALENLLTHKGFQTGTQRMRRNALENLPNFFMVPSSFNHSLMRGACVPRALAKVCATLSNNGKVKGRLREMMTTADNGGGTVGVGLGILYIIKDEIIIPKPIGMADLSRAPSWKNTRLTREIMTTCFQLHIELYARMRVLSFRDE